MTEEQASQFANELAMLCKQHGVMLWNQYSTAPMLLTDVPPDTPFHYEAVHIEVGQGYVIRRMLD